MVQRDRQQPYARVERLNRLLREILAERLERLADHDERLGVITITAVEVGPDLRQATVFLADLTDELADVLQEQRISLQGEIARQVRLKRTPQLRFRGDSSIESGQRVEAILRRLGEEPPVEEVTSNSPIPSHE